MLQRLGRDLALAAPEWQDPKNWAVVSGFWKFRVSQAVLINPRSVAESATERPPLPGSGTGMLIPGKSGPVLGRSGGPLWAGDQTWPAEAGRKFLLALFHPRDSCHFACGNFRVGSG